MKCVTKHSIRLLLLQDLCQVSEPIAAPPVVKFAHRCLSYSRVVVLNDLAHRQDGRQVLVAAQRVDVVQRGRLARVPVRSCEVDTDLRRRTDEVVSGCSGG